MSPTSSSWTVGSDTGSDADSSPLTDSAWIEFALEIPDLSDFSDLSDLTDSVVDLTDSVLDFTDSDDDAFRDAKHEVLFSQKN